ncbi:MAG: hypothetical protein MI685_13175 [Chlorobiales bacterium]|nr:hypothetical protein [Chlorobiales bacterium]
MAVLQRANSARRQSSLRKVRAAIEHMVQYTKRFPIGRARILRLQGVLHALLQRPQRAARAWEQSLLLAEKYAMQLEAGLAHLELGQHAAPGAARANHLREASAVFERLELPYEEGLVACLNGD